MEEKDDDFIIAGSDGDEGEFFWGTRAQFANCYFDNANNANIIEFIRDFGLSLTINGEKFL